MDKNNPLEELVGIEQLASYTNSVKKYVKSQGIGLTQSDVQDMIDESISSKEDKVDGKSLSTNDLTDELKSNYNSAYEHSQVSHAPSDAQKNVQADWNETDTDSDSYIQNKPTITDTKNTSGATDTSSKIYLIGAIAQNENPQTYSQDSTYVGEDGCLYSNNIRVTSELIQSTEPENQKDGDSWIVEYE
jgi:hypothetical protein